MTKYEETTPEDVRIFNKGLKLKTLAEFSNEELIEELKRRQPKEEQQLPASLEELAWQTKYNKKGL